MRVTLWLTALVTLTPIAGALRAQEIQVPVDEAGRIQVITADLARRLGLFPEVDGLREVRLFQLPDSTFVLEITSSPGGVLRRERRPLSATEAADFRRDLSERVTAKAPSAGLDQSGRTKLLVGSMVLGLGYYGWATAAAFDPRDDQTAVALYMLTAGGSFIVPFLATKNTSVPDAVATLSLWGATRGPFHGLFAAELGDAERDKTKFAWTVALGATEAIAGGVAARSLRMTSGRAELTGVGGDIGLGIGFGLADQLELDERSRPFSVPDGMGGTYVYQTEDRTMQAAVLLAGSGLGLAGGYLLGGREEWTRGDAVIFRNVTAMGALAGLAAADIIQQPKLVTQTDPYSGTQYSYVEDGFSRIHSGAGLIGTAAGTVLGRALVTGRNFTTSQGTLLTLSPLAGGLVALGLAYVATPDRQYNPGDPYQDPNDHSELYLAASAVGAAAGFAALYPSMARQARGSGLGANLQFSVNPLAAAQILGGSRGSVPLASLHYRF